MRCIQSNNCLLKLISSHRGEVTYTCKIVIEISNQKIMRVFSNRKEAEVIVIDNDRQWVQRLLAVVDEAEVKEMMELARLVKRLK